MSAAPAVLLLSSAAAFGWGADGHMLIGQAAAPLLCRRATDEVARLSRHESLGTIGQWADEIRGQPEWARAAPWHFVNIPDDGDPRRPPLTAEGDVIFAVERFSWLLTSASATREERENALRFLVHFVADVHQPVHVGRAEDRGGNLIDVHYGDVRTNLHFFWDVDVIYLKGLSVEDYAASIVDRARAAAAAERSTQVRDWASQVFALREQVYDFDSATGLLGPEYLDMAADLAEQQLILAAAHLANTLNDAFCH